MKPNDRQRLVMGFVATNGDITLKEAVNLIGGHLYANAQRHVGATLQRMVNRGLLVRVKPGVFVSASVACPPPEGMELPILKLA